MSYDNTNEIGTLLTIYVNEGRKGLTDSEWKTLLRYARMIVAEDTYR